MVENCSSFCPNAEDMPLKNLWHRRAEQTALMPKRPKRGKLLCVPELGNRMSGCNLLSRSGWGNGEGAGVFPYSFLWMEGNQEAKELKWITNKDLLYSTWNSSRCYMATWMGGEFEREWMGVYKWLSPFAIHLTYHCVVNWLYPSTK